MTAVEWLAEQMQHPKIFNPYIEQAKEMENEQKDNFSIEFYDWQQEQDKKMYSIDDLKEAYAMGRSNYTIKAFNEKFKNK